MTSRIPPATNHRQTELITRQTRQRGRLLTDLEDALASAIDRLRRLAELDDDQERRMLWDQAAIPLRRTLQLVRREKRG